MMRNAEAIFAPGDRSVFDALRFSPAVRAGPFIFISGVIGTREGRKPFDDITSEFVSAFDTIVALLGAAGATLADIVAFDTFHVTDNLLNDLYKFNEVRERYMTAPHPAWTAIGVASLARPGAHAEIRVTAYTGPAATHG